MESGKRYEYFNSPINKHARDKATNITANPKPGNAYQPMRTLALAVIYQALLDARTYRAGESERFFFSDDFKFYAEMAGVRDSGVYTLLQFQNRYSYYLPTVDRLIDGYKE